MAQFDPQRVTASLNSNKRGRWVFVHIILSPWQPVHLALASTSSSEHRHQFFSSLYNQTLHFLKVNTPGKVVLNSDIRFQFGEDVPLPEPSLLQVKYRLPCGELGLPLLRGRSDGKVYARKQEKWSNESIDMNLAHNSFVGLWTGSLLVWVQVPVCQIPGHFHSLSLSHTLVGVEAKVLNFLHTGSTSKIFFIFLCFIFFFVGMFRHVLFGLNPLSFDRSISIDSD